MNFHSQFYFSSSNTNRYGTVAPNILKGISWKMAKSGLCIQFQNGSQGCPRKQKARQVMAGIARNLFFQLISWASAVTVQSLLAPHLCLLGRLTARRSCRSAIWPNPDQRNAVNKTDESQEPCPFYRSGRSSMPRPKLGCQRQAFAFAL